MTLQLSDQQRQAVQRGEVVRLSADGVGEIVVLQTAVFEENRRDEVESDEWARAARSALNSWGHSNAF